MNDTKAWWQSRIIIAQLVAVAFAIASLFHVLPADVDQEQVVAAIMAVVAVVTMILRIRSTHAIAPPAAASGAAGKILAIALLFALPVASLSACGAPPASAGTTPAATATPAAPTTLERIDAAYARIRSSAELVLPILPPTIAARVQVAITLGDLARATIATAANAAEKEQAMRQLESAASTIATATAAD